MMPTTREASTPSRSAISRAESTKTPVVNDLQLRLNLILSADQRQPDQFGPNCSTGLGYPVDAHALHPASHLSALVASALRSSACAGTRHAATRPLGAA